MKMVKSHLQPDIKNKVIFDSRWEDSKDPELIILKIKLTTFSPLFQNDLSSKLIYNEIKNAIIKQNKLYFFN